MRHLSEFMIDPRTRTWSYRCLDCAEKMAAEARAQRLAKQRAYQTTYRAAQRANYLRTAFGMTPEQYEALLTSQGGVCGICGTDSPGRKQRYFSVDHDHACCPAPPTCGSCTRGLLCVRCNWAVEIVNDIGTEPFRNYLEGGREETGLQASGTPN